MTAGIDRIPDSLGYLVFNEDGVLCSGGDLENDEDMANKFMAIVQTALRIQVGTADAPSTFKRLSVIWDDFLYVLTVSNHKVFVSKRRHVPLEPALV